MATIIKGSKTKANKNDVEVVEDDKSAHYLTDGIWDQIKAAYLRENMNVEDKKSMVTLRDLADRYNVNYGTLRNRASQDGWNKELQTQVARMNEKVMDGIVELTAEKEIEVRTRHSRIARLCVSKALKVLSERELNDLHPRDLLQYIKTGMEQERLALGMPEKFDISHRTQEHPVYQDVEAHIRDHQKKMELLNNLMEFAKMKKQELAQAGS